jgi:hypothetical protein
MGDCDEGFEDEVPRVPLMSTKEAPPNTVAMNERDVKDLKVFRYFMSEARGHCGEPSDRPHPKLIQRYEAESLRERLILKLGTFPDDAIVYEHAKKRFDSRPVRCPMSDKTFDGELEPGTRESWVRAARLVLVSFSDDSYRRLADATAQETVRVRLDEIKSDGIRNGWILAAEVALHVPVKLWDDQSVEQNLRGMHRLLGELER